jgi:RNA-binding protein 5/10
MKGKEPSAPSRDVIFLGLDPELTENEVSCPHMTRSLLSDNQLMGYLRAEHQAVLDSVNIARDKKSGSSKFFGFAQFSSRSGAEEFVANK